MIKNFAAVWTLPTGARTGNAACAVAGPIVDLKARNVCEGLGFGLGCGASGVALLCLVFYDLARAAASIHMSEYALFVREGLI